MAVDPDAINSAGKIEIQFTEEVTGYIVLQTGSGEDLDGLEKLKVAQGSSNLSRVENSDTIPLMLLSVKFLISKAMKSSLELSL